MTSRDLPTVDGDIRFARGDVRSVHEAMTTAAGADDLWVVGGDDLAGQFADAGLLDEIILHIAPVTLGGGAPLLLAHPSRSSVDDPVGQAPSVLQIEEQDHEHQQQRGDGLEGHDRGGPLGKPARLSP